MPYNHVITQRRMERKRKRRIERLLQKFDLLDHRATVYRVWSWNARRQVTNSLAHVSTR